MKKVLLVALGLIFIATWLIAKQAKIMQTEQLGEVLISNTAWTAIPPVGTIDENRISILIDLDRSVTDQILITLSTSSISPGIAISSGMAYKESDPPWELQISPGVFLWGVVDGGAGAESLYYWELQ